MLAIKMQREDVIEVMLAKCSEIELKLLPTEYKSLPLKVALETDMTSVVEQLVSENMTADLITGEDADEDTHDTILHVAASNGNTEHLQLLLMASSASSKKLRGSVIPTSRNLSNNFGTLDTNAPNGFGRTPLHLAGRSPPVLSTFLKLCSREDFPPLSCI
jgi:hypothetical protein